MIIDCISDLHGNFPELEGGDLLILGGDYTSNDRSDQYIEFGLWLDKQRYKKKVLIAGNHDVMVENTPKILDCPIWDYLCDSGTEFEGLKIWGSPWTKTFRGMNPRCKAFTMETDEELGEKWELIPPETDVLITHSPMHGCLDQLQDGTMCGSSTLQDRIAKLKPKLHVCGHIHEGYEEYHSQEGLSFYPTIFVNASYVNEYYEPVNRIVRIIL